MTLHQVNPNDDAIVESLPKQEEFYRAPARFGNVPSPTQITERVELSMSSDHEPNRVHT